MNEIFFNMAKDKAVLCLLGNRTANVQREIRFHCKDEPIEIASSRILQLEKDAAHWTRNISVYCEEDSRDITRAEKCASLLQDFLRKKKGYSDESMPHMLVIMVTHLPVKGLGVYRARVNKVAENRDERYDMLFVFMGYSDDR